MRFYLPFWVHAVKVSRPTVGTQHPSRREEPVRMLENRRATTKSHPRTVTKLAMQ